MTDAEKKWREWDNEFTELEGILPAQCYRHSREAYKESLRSAIEKKIKDVPKGFTYPMSAQELLDLLDQVTPK